MDFPPGKPYGNFPSTTNLHFLQKLGCEKFCWDQTRLSSLVNKQVETGTTASTEGMAGTGGGGLGLGGKGTCIYSKEEITL